MNYLTIRARQVTAAQPQVKVLILSMYADRRFVVAALEEASEKYGSREIFNTDQGL